MSYCRVTRVTALLPPSPITSSCHVLARSTMFFCAILYRRQIWIVERSCCARNRQLRRWAPKGLHRIHRIHRIEHQQLSSLSSLKGIRQNRSRLRFEILLPLFVANVHIRMHTYYEIIYTGNRTTPTLFYFTSALEKLLVKKRLAYGTSWDERKTRGQSKKDATLFAANLSHLRPVQVYTTRKESKIAEHSRENQINDHYGGSSSIK